MQMGAQTTEAEAEYRLALELDPNLSVTHNNLGLLALERGRLDLAEQLFREELSLNPSYDKACFNLALALKRQGRLDEAAASLEKAVAINPENEDALEGLMSYYAFRGNETLSRSFAEKLRLVRAGSNGS